MARQIIPCVAAGALLTSFASGLHGQRYAFGVSADITGSADNPITTGFGTTTVANETGTNLGSFPTVDFTGRGERYSFQTSYSLGATRSFVGAGSSTNSHAANFSYNTKLGPKWNLNLSDHYEQTKNSSTFRLFRGDSSIADSNSQDFNFIFDPILVDSRQTNYASVGMDRKLSDHSSLNFSFTQSYLKYSNRSDVVNGLSDEWRSSVSAGYSRTVYRGSWHVTYSGSQSKFSIYPTSRTHSATFGFSRQLSKTVTLNINGGPAYVTNSEIDNNYFGANVSIGVYRTIRNGGFSFTFSQSAGDSSGIGSVSQNQQATVGMNHSLGRRASFSLDLSAFNVRDQFVTTVSTIGFSGGGSIGYSFARMWSANVGAQYQHYEGYSQFNQDHKRVFVSMRFRNPNIWRF